MKRIVSVTMLIVLFNGLAFGESDSYNEQIIYSDGDYTVSVMTDSKQPRYLPFSNMGSRRWQNCIIKWWYNPAYQPFTTEEMLEAIKSSVNAWERICGIKFVYMGITNQELTNKADDKLVIGWLPQNIFEERFGAYSGYARVWWGNLTYIYDGEISLNVNGPKNDSIYNLQGVITHEFGHIVGLTHSDIQESIMFANPYPTPEYMRTLRQDDINGAVSLYPYSSCGECLSGWSQYVSGTGSFQSAVNGSDCTYMNISLSDTTSETMGGRKKLFPNATGMIATFNVSQASGYNSGYDTLIGMGNAVGKTPEGNKIYAYIRLSYYSEQYRIYYKIYEEGSRNRTLARGYFGDWSGMWSFGQDVTIGFACMENEIWFFSSSDNNWLKIQFNETIIHIDSEMLLYGWVNKGSIASSVSKVCILYPNKLAVFPAPKIAGDFNNDGRIDLKEAINALQIITGIRNQ